MIERAAGPREFVVLLSGAASTGRSNYKIEMFWSKTGGEFGQRRRSAGAAEGTELLQALFVQLSAAADAVLSSPLGWPTRYSHTYRLEKRRAE